MLFNMTGGTLSKVDAEELDREAQSRGFERKGRGNWFRRTRDFVQLVNLQQSQWSSDVRYINFAMWQLALGEPPSLVEYKFHFRTRAESIGATDLHSFFSMVDELTTLDHLRNADRSGRLPCLITKDLRSLLDTGA